MELSTKNNRILEYIFINTYYGIAWSNFTNKHSENLSLSICVHIYSLSVYLCNVTNHSSCSVIYNVSPPTIKLFLLINSYGFKSSPYISLSMAENVSQYMQYQPSLSFNSR